MKSNEMKKPSMAKKAVLVAGLIAVMVIPSMMAYFTDGDTATNVFTVGDVSIDLQEEDWVPPTNITPEQEFDKTPTIVNDGTNDAYTFIKVTVGCADVVTANEDGTKNASADTQLFTWAKNNGWVQVGDVVKDEEAQTHTYVYAYGTDSACTALKAGERTTALFDNVEFANVVEDEGLEGATLNIKIDGFAIQTTNINDGNADTLTGSNADGKVAPADVWSVLNNQSPSTTVSADEDANTDVKKAE